MMILLRKQKRSRRNPLSVYENKKADVTEIRYIRLIWRVAPKKIFEYIPACPRADADIVVWVSIWPKLRLCYYYLYIWH